MKEITSPTSTVQTHHSIWNHRYESLLVSKELRDFVEKYFPSLNEDGFRIFFWYLNTCSYRNKDGKILLESKMLSQLEGRDEENTQAEKFMIRFNESVLVPIGGRLKYTNYSHEEHRCRALDHFNMGKYHKEFIRLWNSEENWPKDSINSQRLVFASTGKVATYKALQKLRKQEIEEAMSRPCGALTKELLEYMNGKSLCTQVYTELIKRNWEDAHNACLQIKDKILREQQLRLLREIKQNPRAFYFPSIWGLTPRVFTHGGIPELKRELRIILCDGWHDADLVSSQLAICASLWKLTKIEKFLETGRKVWDEIQETLKLSEEDWKKFKPYVKESLYTICYGGGDWMVKEPLIDGIKTHGLDFSAYKVLNHWIFKELKKGQLAIEKKIEEEGGMSDAEEKWCNISSGRKASSVMAEVAQSYELKILISVIRLAKETGNKLFKITVWQHDGFSMYIERNHKEVYEMIEKAVQNEQKLLNIKTKIEFSISKKKDIDPSKIEKRRKVERNKNKGKRKVRDKNCSPFVSHINIITEKNFSTKQKPSQTIGDLIKPDISQAKKVDWISNRMTAENSNMKESLTQIDTAPHKGWNTGVETERKVDTAELNQTAEKTAQCCRK